MSYNSGAQRVPAWKRLGLKLKGPAAGEDPASSPSSGNVAAAAIAHHPTQAPQQRFNGQQNSLTSSPASALKRKQQPPVQTPNKKLRLDQQTTPGSVPSTLKRQKSVSFAADTKEDSKEAKKAKQPKKAKKPKKAAEPKPDFSLEPALAYLRQWHSDRPSWKFNKNHQTLLIKYMFDSEKIPSSDIVVFYEYIRDLKGFVRTRLRETAQEIKKQDMEQGVAAFPSSTKDKEDKQKEYEEAISEYLQSQQQYREQNASGTNANGKRPFDEVEFVIRLAHPEVKQRLLKRIRAEMVLDELSDTESTDTTMTTTSTTSSTAEKEATGGAKTSEEQKATSKPSDGSVQPAKRRRLRSIRAVGDDESSSDSSSDEGSDDDSDDDENEGEDDDSSSSSSSSSDDDDSDEEMSAPDGLQDDGEESSSSSSSSSGSDAESDDGNDENESSSESSDGSDEE